MHITIMYSVKKGSPTRKSARRDRRWGDERTIRNGPAGVFILQLHDGIGVNVSPFLFFQFLPIQMVYNNSIYYFLK